MITLIVTLLVVGVLLYLVETNLPIDPGIKKIIHVVVLLAVILYICRFFGVF